MPDLMLTGTRTAEPEVTGPSAPGARPTAAASIPALRRWLPHVLTLAALLACVQAVAFTLTDIQTVPIAGNDEWWFTSRYDRLARYGDLSDKVGFDLYANHGNHGKLPPANFVLRSIIHGLTGVGAELTRYISAAQFGIVGVLTGIVVWRMGAPLAVAAFSLPFVLLFPTAFFFARSLRFEQDVFFFGCLSLLLVLLEVHGPRFRSACLAASGVAAGMAASMHVYGVPFGGAIVGTYLGHRIVTGRALAPRSLAILWVLAFGVPVVATVAYFLADPINSIRYYQANRAYETAHLPQRLASLIALGPPPVAWLPDPVTAALNSVRWGLTPFGSQAGGALVGTSLIDGWTVAALLVLLGGSAGIAWRLARARQSPVDDRRTWAFALLWLALVLALFVSIVRPNVDYAIYFDGLVCLILYVAIACWWRRRGLLDEGARLTALAAIAALGAAYLVPAVAANSGAPNASAAVQISAMRRMSEAVGLSPDRHDGPPIYADSVTWGAAGARLAPIYEVLTGDVADWRSDYDGAVWSDFNYSTTVQTRASFSGAPIDPDHRRELMEALLADLHFAGALAVAPGPARALDTQFFYTRTVPATPVFMELTRNGYVQTWRTRAAEDRSLHVESGGQPTILVLSSAPGRYFATIGGDGLAGVRIDVRANGTTLSTRTISAGIPGHGAGVPLWLEVETGQQVEVVIQGSTSSSADVHARIWRLLPPD
ncbi:MAG: hypothetical protein IT305_18180 [Chloroflexi bacterium]|nr:hypothetical protein [Chloroflexota bacterium]